MKKSGIILIIINLWQINGFGQRHYADASVLAAGNWYKIAVSNAGVYKVDLALLSKLGVNKGNISSSAIRLYGNGGGMLPESCNGFKWDDLKENAIKMVDGGDGIFNGNDYFLFYASGPDTWTKDSINQRFVHQKNLYSTQTYYYINISGTGKRIVSSPDTLVANTQVNSFSERYFHELDSLNFLNSGKDWYGESFSNLQGQTSSHVFSIPLTDIDVSAQASLVSNCVARSIGSPAVFSINANGLQVMQQSIPSTGNSNFDLFAKSSKQVESFTPGNTINLTYNFSSGALNANGWLDWFELFCRRNLLFTDKSQLFFRDWNSVGAGNICAFKITNGLSVNIWDITDPFSIIEMKGKPAGNDLVFVNDAASLHEYIAFSGNLPAPDILGKIENQNLHQSGPADLLIVTSPQLLTESQRLAVFHQQKDNMRTVVVTADQVFNEFGSGTPDPTAIRDFVKMYYDKAGGDSSKMPRYLLLFGSASFDYKNRIKNNSNLVPAYENNLSLDPLSTYTSDDFFGFLDDVEDINSGLVTNYLQIGIGRIPAKTTVEARAYVDKLINYYDPKSMGPWRNQQTFIADDQDFNLHFNDAESITAAAAITNPLLLQDKIYLDAYTQVSTTAGSRYPEVNLAINNQIQKGTLIWNYNGHGSATRLAEEVVLEQPVIDSWNNPGKLPLFITATCDFAPFDNPTIPSLGANLLLREKTGGIALMTTTRLVFAYSNLIMNRNYLQFALQPRVDGSYLSLGEAVKRAKNYTYQTQADITNNRKFTLLGDPAATLAFPRFRVQTDTINGLPAGNQPDTLKALEPSTIAGRITDAQGQLLGGFNGTITVTVFDKPQLLSTKANDADSYKANFLQQNNPLFKGKATVSNGLFQCSFVVPKDINYQPGNGRISYYAENGITDANGSFTEFLLGGSAGISADITGPEIKAYLNDEKFLNGMIVNETPVLIIHLTDASGINIAGTGIGHDITAMLDGNPGKTYVLNDFYEADLGSYQNGTVNFQLPLLADGPHTLTIKAWDVANNSSETQLSFRVINRKTLTLNNVFNYPNPFTHITRFSFDHNRPHEDLLVDIQVYTLSGSLVKTISQTINTNGNRSNDIEWNLLDKFGTIVAPGIYFYQVQVRSKDGQKLMKAGKLMVL